LHVIVPLTCILLTLLLLGVCRVAAGLPGAAVVCDSLVWFLHFRSVECDSRPSRRIGGRGALRFCSLSVLHPCDSWVDVCDRLSSASGTAHHRQHSVYDSCPQKPPSEPLQGRKEMQDRGRTADVGVVAGTHVLPGINACRARRNDRSHPLSLRAVSLVIVSGRVVSGIETTRSRATHAEHVHSEILPDTLLDRVQKVSGTHSRTGRSVFRR